MALSFSIAPALPLSSTNSSSFSSSTSLFFCNNKSQPFLGKLQSRITHSANKRRGLSCTCLFGLGVPELVVIAGVAAIVFGPKKLPEVGRSIGKTVKSFQQAAKEFETELKKDPEAVGETPSEEIPAVSNEEGQDTKVSSIKES